VSPVFAAVVAGGIPISSCLTEPTNGITDGVEIYSPEINPDWAYSVYLEDDPSDPFALCGSTADSQLQISTEQFQACTRLLEQEAANQGVICGPPS
jgi:hypothetical protein